ncbi:MAG TPA: hypothetical protein VMO00_04035 [Methylomirabilota bacterium]|nr:hypothetical protein [Methylomirabilota bacterium]
MNAHQAKLSLEPRPRLNLRYSHVLRCIGQSLESLDLKALELKTHGNSYLVQGWSRGTSVTKEIDRQYTMDDIKTIEREGLVQRKPLSGLPNLLSLSQVLRLAGNYVDRMRGRLVRVSWQDQSERIQSVTIQYEPFPAERSEQGESQITTIEELCVHVYKQRKKIVSTADKSGQRPLVSVNNGG